MAQMTIVPLPLWFLFQFSRMQCLETPRHLRMGPYCTHPLTTLDLPNTH